MPGLGNRIIIDTNLWISFLLTKDFSKLDKLLADNHVTILFSNELIEEFIDVIQRPKFEKYFAKTDIQALLLAINDRSEMVNVSHKATICRDAKDNFLLSLAKDGVQLTYLQATKTSLILNCMRKQRSSLLQPIFRCKPIK